MSAAEHVHEWSTESRHRTSEGTVAYERCACGRWRIRRDSSVAVDHILAVTPTRSSG